ncbi:hypothetical protein PA25_22450 [Pseudoalteromonas sp. A25]|uniref:hypothetical protein n=1 Tax=Pseudoalteromonas sp. A25 TaxID=116092 RepID=UPI0012609A0E|nr:hypothetical protein [Pseudoalteromonas sp. A25]BBN82260.1 hypothetical protein PA25_22450 [Pseudoalteromonas sp. A25]
MSRSISLVFCLLGLFGCKSTPPEVEYFERNYEAMSAYNIIHGNKIEELSAKINNECVFKRMNSKNLNFAELVSIPLNGIVIYDLTEQGVISSALYVSKDQRANKQRKQKCIEEVAIGFQLPRPESIDRVFSKFDVNIE